LNSIRAIVVRPTAPAKGGILLSPERDMPPRGRHRRPTGGPGEGRIFEKACFLMSVDA
jgi:hypothetical protein